MKKFLSALLVYIMLFSITPGYADSSYTQEDFLADMAAGIKERLAYSKDHTDSDQETRRKLVEFELEHIEKYDSVSFEDSKFDTLAHGYIEACKFQRLGTDYFRNQDLYKSLWNGGSTTRSGIIVFFYEMYNLDLTEEEASNYRNSSSSVSYSIVSSSDKSRKLLPGDITFISGKLEKNSYGQKVLNYSFRNNTEEDIGLALTCELFNSKNQVIGTRYGYTDNGNADGRVSGGQIIKCQVDLNWDMPDDAVTIRIAKVNCNLEEDIAKTFGSRYYDLTAKELEKSIIKIS